MSNQNLALQLVQLYRQQSFDSGSPPTPDQWDTLEAAIKKLDEGAAPALKQHRITMELGALRGRWEGNCFVFEEVKSVQSQKGSRPNVRAK